MTKKGINLRSEKNTKIRMLELEEYCKKYNEWPRDYRFKTGDKEKQGRSLYLWLTKNNYKYGENTFKCGYVILDNGYTAQSYLDSLYSKYATNIHSSEVYAMAMVDKVLDYVNKYKEFPRNFLNAKNKKEKLSTDLYRWLQSTGYLRQDGSFKYKDCPYNSDKTVEEVLLDAQINAKKISGSGRARALYIINELETFCNHHNAWPQKFSKDPESRKLYVWLESTKYKYNNDDFIYNDAVDENGISLKERIDALYRKYGHTCMRSDLHKARLIEEIQSYSLKYDDFPKANPRSTIIEADKSRTLANFVVFSNALSDTKEFKFPGVTENGLDREELLRTYYSIFSYKKQVNMGNLNLLNRIQAKNSRNVGLVLYYYFGGYLKAMIFNNREDMFNIINIINNYSKRKHFNVDWVGIIASFNAPIHEALIYHFQKYTEYSIQNNNDLALLHKCLYEYTKYVAVHLKHNKDADLSDTISVFK